MTLINLMIESYASIFYTVGAIALLLFVVGLYFIFRQQRRSAATSNTINFSVARKSGLAEKAMLPDTANDVTSIAGDDPMATQLDLARAYIETGKMQFAKIILKTVIREGSTTHQEEAQRLLGSL